MRARLALASSGTICELREIVLRDKAQAFLEASPKGTVPVLVLGDKVIEESLDIMHWALEQHDPEGLLEMPGAGHELIALFDTEFKTALDRYKYANRYDGADPLEHREKAARILWQLDKQIAENDWLYGTRAGLADIAILPFIRQFAHVDKGWFDGAGWTNLTRWLDAFLSSARFASIMAKYPRWEPGQAVVLFPAAEHRKKAS